jgi:hypothetical protein
MFETMLTRFREAGLRKPRGRQRTDWSHVLAATQTLNRLECVGETLRYALNVLAVVSPPTGCGTTCRPTGLSVTDAGLKTIVYSQGPPIAKP